MVISIFGTVVVVAMYLGVWYAVGFSRKRAFAGKDSGLKWLWRINAAALLGSGACFVAAALLNVPNRINWARQAEDATGQGIAAVVAVIVLGTLAFVSTRRTARAKASEVAAAKIPSGYTVKTAPDPQPATYVPSFAEKIGASKAENIIAEIKGGSW